MSNRLPHIITSTFLVTGKDLNNKKVLQLCKMLSMANEHNDEAIKSLLGTLDFNRVSVDHYYLDFIGDATLADVVTFRSYAYLHEDELIEITLSATKNKGEWAEPILNGSFVFTVKSGIPVSYALS